MVAQMWRWQPAIGQIESANREREDFAGVGLQAEAIDLSRVRSVGAEDNAGHRVQLRAVRRLTGTREDK